MSGLRSIDFASYRELLGALCPDGFVFALTHPDGQPCWRDDEFPSLTPEELVPEQVLETVTEPKRVQLSSANGSVFVMPIRANNALIALLWAAVPASAEDPSTKWLCAVAEQLSKDLSLNAELDAMATELGERYEELNLVYHTEDQVNYFAEGQAALEQLVVNCCDYLGVDLAALVMKDKGVMINHQSNRENIPDAEQLIERIGDNLYRTIAENRDAVVINDPSSQEALEFLDGLPYRLLAMPILDSKGNANGVLAIVNIDGKDKFSNSDKNLLQVLSRKAAKIVQVNYDALTGLVNREGLEFLAEQALKEALSNDTTHCLLHIDIDQLHVTNDTVSHDAGDALIKAIAQQLRINTRDSDLASRIGGDELAVLLRQCSLERGTVIADKLREGIVGLTVPWADRSLHATVSIGVAPIDSATESAGAALAAAELACDAAKEMGKNRVQRFHHGDTGLMRRHHEMEAVGRIQEAIKNDRFVLFGQLIEPLTGDKPGVHLEVLLRIVGVDSQIEGPMEFLPAAERYHLMPEIDRWVLRKTLTFLNDHWDKLENELSLISINLSGQTLNEPGFAKLLIEMLGKLRVPLDRICFEITETVAVASLEAAIDFMQSIKRHGCRFSLDDFGSGVSSFGYLRSLPVDYLKIDGSIVKEIADDEIAASIVTAIQHVASVMNLETIAEYVESQAIKDKLREIGVSYGQGYALGKPRPLVDHFGLGEENVEAVTG